MFFFIQSFYMLYCKSIKGKIGLLCNQNDKKICDNKFFEYSDLLRVIKY